jgi:hypothetical protein
MVGDVMGTTSLSTDDRWWIVPVKMSAIAQLHAIDTASGQVEVVIEHPSIGHPQVHPDDPSLIRFAGRSTERIHVVRRDGRSCVTDTKHPDRGRFTFDPSADPESPVNQLAESRSSNAGDHWNTDHCPYDGGPVTVHAPQHTHPHPSFSPDGSRVVFTSDRPGVAQVYKLVVGRGT